MSDLTNPATPNTQQPLISLNAVHKVYPGGFHALKGINLDVARGEVIAIVGPSGCGKSTLLKTINGLEDIQFGSISLLGNVISGYADTTSAQSVSAQALPYDEHAAPQDVELPLHPGEKPVKTKWKDVRTQVGMVFQNYELFPHLTVMKNLLLGPKVVQGADMKEAEQRARALLKRVGLEHKADAKPRELSGGQKQRVAIVRALMMQPKALLLDEITASLDPEIVREVLDVVMDLAKEGMTMLVVTHEMPFARAVADRIVFMDAGQIVEVAPPQQFFTNPQSKRAQAFLDTFVFE